MAAWKSKKVEQKGCRRKRQDWQCGWRGIKRYSFLCGNAAWGVSAAGRKSHCCCCAVFAWPDSAPSCPPRLPSSRPLFTSWPITKRSCGSRIVSSEIRLPTPALICPRYETRRPAPRIETRNVFMTQLKQRESDLLMKHINVIISGTRWWCMSRLLVSLLNHDQGRLMYSMLIYASFSWVQLQCMFYDNFPIRQLDDTVPQEWFNGQASTVHTKTNSILWWTYFSLPCACL